MNHQKFRNAWKSFISDADMEVAVGEEVLSFIYI